MHTNPEVLAMLAIGEEAGTVTEREHVTACPDCSEEVAELARIADIGRLTTESDSITTPSPDVWERIKAELGFEDARSVPPTEEPVFAAEGVRPAGQGNQAAHATVSRIADRRNQEQGPDPTRRTSAGRRFLALAVAAALALIVGIGVGISYEQRVISPESRVIASAVLAPTAKWPGATGTAQVIADGRGGRELVLKMVSPEPVQGTVHVWLMTNEAKDPFPMGILDADGEAHVTIPAGMSLFQRPMVDLSDEPTSDPKAIHSGNSIVRGALV